ncbi:hypothetical protein [Rhizobium sp. NFR12]|uniref:hypothetical protein n=1 Tax=Rhizobium sp. NFR12 TaxID=1566261 RepID=UPI0008A784AB|nr:hypothetical protein [Rhizobium sp. NFR12]SEH23583.1 hypothetical protein SAMN03159407_1678 [Rhizobium sp. NFR12]
MEVELRHYGVDEHRRRFAAWTAATAARSSKNCRFTRQQGIFIIERSGLSKLTGWQDLPLAKDFDDAHSELRMAVLETSRDVLGSSREGFTHGVAAKLINVYLKCLFLTGPEAWSDASMQEKANALHPPIDRFLLGNLAVRDVGGRAGFWRKQLRIGWSNFNSEDYQRTIDNIRYVTSGALWTIEQYWLMPSLSAAVVARANLETDDGIGNYSRLPAKP